jgi:DNA processing protein
VLGTPLDRVYPRHHVHLQRQVAQQGLLVSEQRQGTAVQAGHFASRNRLQVALATALIVVECPVASGALHSAERAWREGLPLWVVPADVGRVSAAGSNRLLCRGATALLAPEDLIGQLGPGPLGAAAPAAGTRPDDGVSLTTDQRVLLAAIGSGANLEELSQALGSTPSALSRRLLDLELAGLVVAEAGLCWRPR